MAAIEGSLQLQDIHMPSAPDLWPPAIGWWILLTFLIVTLIWFLQKIRREAKQKKYRDAIRAKFKQLEKQLNKNPTNQTIAEINTLLRQVAISRYPREQIASLTGAKWLLFLDKSGKTNNFSKGAGRILVDASYQADNLSNLNLIEFTPLIRRWVRKVLGRAETKQNSAKTFKKGGGVL